MSLERAARQVLQQYPAASAGSPPVALGNRGGFSGASLWRTSGLAGDLCLRAWPIWSPSLSRLQFIHEGMRKAAAAGLGFVPTLYRAQDGETWIEHAGRLWELTAWMPGRADFQAQPTLPRLRAACTALARLHAAWAFSSSSGPCPAVRQRLDCARAWLALVGSGWVPNLARSDADRVLPWARLAWQLLHHYVPQLERQLAPWVGVSVRLQPCLCDVWHDHLLFQGEQVSGIVDYGSVKMNHVAADLARMLGSLIGDDRERQEMGLAAYRELQPLSAEEAELMRLLDRTGTILAAVNWLRWLYHDGRHFEDRALVAARLGEVVRRLQSWELSSSAFP